MSSSTVAVVVPVYNRPTVAVEALQSVMAQTHSPTRVVVVDDGSTDRTPEVLAEWIEGEGASLGVELIRQDNQGVAAARNRGVEAAGECELLAFLDSDDLWPADYLKRAAATLGQHPDAVAATADRLSVDEKTGERRLDRRAWVASGQSTARMFLDGPPGLSNTIYRTAAFHQAGGYDPAMRICEDYHLHLRVSLLGTWLHLPGEPVHYRQHTADTTDPQQQLSQRFDDRRLRLAQMLEQFAEKEGGAAAMAGHAWRRRLARVWHSAGRQLRRLGQAEEAVMCFERALALCPWHLRARLARLTLPASSTQNHSH